MRYSAQEHPRLPEALEALRKCGHAVGQSTINAQGSTMVTVGGKVLPQEDIFRLAGMPEAAAELGNPAACVKSQVF